MSQDLTSMDWTERQRRTHFQLQPWNARIDLTQGTGETERSPLSIALQTVQSATLTDETTKPITAPLELLAYQQPDGQVTYLFSTSTAITESNTVALRDVLQDNYAVKSVNARSAEFDALFDGIPADAFTTRVRPPVKYSTYVPQYPAVSAGDVVVQLLQRIQAAQQQLPEIGTWLVQVLACPWNGTRELPLTADAAGMLSVQIRMVLIPAAGADFQQRLESSDFALAQPPTATKLRLRNYVSDPEFITDTLAARFQPSSSFVAPSAYARGLLFPPSRTTSLFCGVPGTASPLEHCPANAVDRLIKPTVPVGVEPLPPAGSFSKRAVLGLSGTMGRVLKVGAEPQGLQVTAPTDVQALSMAGAPMFAVSTLPGVLRRYGETYTALQSGTTSLDVPTGEIEYVGSDRIEPMVEMADDVSFFTDRLDETPSLTLLDVSQLDDPAAAATTLLSQLTQAGAAVTPSQSRSEPVGSVVFAAPWPLAPTTDAQTRLETALQRVDNAELLLTLHTLYPEVEVGTIVTDWDRLDTARRQSAYDQLARIAQVMDLSMLQNGGPVDRLYQHDRLPTVPGLTPLEIKDRNEDSDWNTYVRPHSSSDPPVAIPLSRLTTVTGFDRTVPTDTEYTMSRPERTAGASPEPTVQTDSAGSASTGETSSTTADPNTVTIERRHVPRTHADLPVEYDHGQNGYVCQACRADTETDASVYERSKQGLFKAINCCHTIEEIEREAVRHVPEPVVPSALLEDTAHELSEEEYRFLAVLYVLQTGQFDYAVEYDPVVDSGVDIRDDVGISYQIETRLVEDDYIVRTNNPSKLYSLTDRGLEAIGQTEVQDNEQFHSMFERRLRRAVKLYMTDQYAESSAQVKTDLPYDVAATDSRHPSRATLDIVVQADDSTLVAGCGLYTPETDATSAVDQAPAASETAAFDDETVITYQTLAAAKPDTAQWVAWTQADAVALVNELTAAAAADRVTFNADTEKDPDTARVQYFNFDEPGLTDVNTIKHCVDTIEPAWIGQGDTFVLRFGGETDE
ncbi:hypothetical protein [Natrinema sp. H-ect4]|uniref:hypothetical protein n=1 Tax=Natrinema sp. H-ect4 TaxID=3242699 RepID=UPI0035A9904A